jgi:actin
MEKIWHHLYFNGNLKIFINNKIILYLELHVAPEEQAVFTTDAMYGPKPNRERTVQIFFEKFQVPAFHIAIQAVLSLFSTGNLDGLVVECGGGITHVVPVYEGLYREKERGEQQ